MRIRLPPRAPEHLHFLCMALLYCVRSVEKWSQRARAARDITVHMELKLVLRVDQASREMLGDVSVKTSSWPDCPQIVEKARLANHDWSSVELDAFNATAGRARANGRLPLCNYRRAPAHVACSIPITGKFKTIAQPAAMTPCRHS